MSKFEELAHRLDNRKGVTDPKALAAYIGRKKYSKKVFQKMAEAGKRKLHGGA